MARFYTTRPIGTLRVEVVGLLCVGERQWCTVQGGYCKVQVLQESIYWVQVTRGVARARGVGEVLGVLGAPPGCTPY